MRYLAVLFWTLALGRAVGYTGGALSGSSYDFKMTMTLPSAIAVIILLVVYFVVSREIEPVK